MQLRGVDLRSVGPSSQKLWPNQIFSFFPQSYYIMSPKNEIAPFSLCPTSFLKIVLLSEHYPQQKKQPSLFVYSKKCKNETLYHILSYKIQLWLGGYLSGPIAKMKSEKTQCVSMHKSGHHQDTIPNKKQPSLFVYSQKCKNDTLY